MMRLGGKKQRRSADRQGRMGSQDADHTSTYKVQSTTPCRHCPLHLFLPFVLLHSMPKRKLDSDTVSPSRRSSINNKAAEADDGDDSLPGSERKGHTSAAAKGGVEVELPPDVEYFPNVGASARRSTRSPQFLRDDGAYDELAALETCELVAFGRRADNRV